MIVGIFGNLSSGKTVFAVSLCYSELKTKTVISNIKLGFKYKYLDLDQIFDAAVNNSLIFENSILFADEVHNLVDARRSNSDLNQKFTQFITQIGKLNCDFVFTSQVFSSQIDVRIRELCDILCFCERGAIINGSFQSLTLARRILDIPVTIKIIMLIKTMGGAKIQQKMCYFDPQPFYKLYDTREIVLLDRSKYLKA